MSENKYEINDYKSAFKCFKQRFLKEHLSIFRLDDNENKVLTENSVKYLMDNFVNNGYSGDVSFIEKIRSQLVETPKDKVHMKNAIEILATVVWLWRVPPINAKDRKSSVYEILKLDDDLKNINLDNNPFFNKFEGFASTLDFLSFAFIGGTLKSHTTVAKISIAFFICTLSLGVSTN
jgi:hypothetical protein